MRGAQRGLWRGTKANSGKEFGQGIQGKGRELLQDHLARRPRWGGGALRAFRRAEIIFDVVLFERCVGGVAVAMTFTSIFDLDFWFVSCRFGCFFWCLLEAFVSPESVSGTSSGVIWGPWAHFWGSSEVFLAAEACLGGPLGVPGDSWDVLGRLGGDFRDFPGNSGRPFGSILGLFLLFF